MMTRPNIFSQLDYRTLLKELFAWFKDQHSYFSYGYLTQKVSIDKSSFLKVLKGDRHLPTNKLEALTKVFKLSSEEAKYFIQLVYYSRAQTEEEKELHLETLKNLRPVDQLKLGKDQADFFNTWYNSVIWLIIGMTPCTPRTQIAKFVSPKITKAKAKEAIELLIRLDLIYLDTEGFYCKRSNNIKVDKELNYLDINIYLQNSFKLASQALKKYHKEERDVSSLIVDMPEDKLPEIKAKINDFRKELIREINTYEKSDKVYQMSFQIFPLSSKV